ncbi:unnamed protein product [Brassica rapa subsp. narinosa]
MESFIASRENPIENIKFIDTLCRLGGVNYNFKKISHSNWRSLLILLILIRK